MKKTLLSFAAVAAAVCANAAEPESFICVEEDGSPKAIYSATVDPSEANAVDISTPNVKAVQVSGPVAGFIDGSELPLAANYDNTFGSTQVPGQKNNPWVYMAPSTDPIGFYFVQGKGNPVDLDKIVWEEITTDGEGTGVYKANWEASYYNPDGSMGIPSNGTFAEFTPALDGELSVLCWINKGNRSTYVAKGSDKKALALGSEVKISGWVHGMTYTEEEVGEGSPLIGMNKFMENVPTWTDLNPDASEATIEDFTKRNVYPDYIIGGGNQIAIVYLTFDVIANESYYIFNNSSQIALNSYTFTPSGESALEMVAAEENAPVEYFNLQGIRVADPDNGVYLRRQGNNVSKVVF